MPWLRLMPRKGKLMALYRTLRNSGWTPQLEDGAVLVNIGRKHSILNEKPLSEWIHSIEEVDK